MLSRFRRIPDVLTSFVEKRPFLCVIIVIAYIVSPVDLLPGFVLGPLGGFDDALVAIAALSLLKKTAETRRKRRAESPPPPRPAPAPVARLERPAGSQEPRGDRRPDRGRDNRGDHRRGDRHRGDNRQGDNRRGGWNGPRRGDPRRGDQRPPNQRGSQQPGGPRPGDRRPDDR